MQREAQKVNKNERVRVRSGADEEKEKARERAEARGADPEEAAAEAEEQTAADEAEETVAIDEFGEKMGEHYLEAAVSGEKPADRGFDAVREQDGEAVVTTDLDELASGHHEVPEDAEPAAEPSPMRQKD